DVTINGRQIDIFYTKNNTIYLFECTISIRNEKEAKEKIKQIQNQIKSLKKKYPNYSIFPLIVVYAPLQGRIKNYLEKCGIKVEENFRNKIKYPLFSKTNRNIIIHILEGK
ncbi:MAG: hypothetical protein DRP00_06355, partial [Candidatus Aenigmatarchaeota archaeon]